MAEAHAADRGVSMEGEGAAGVHGFAFRERPVEEPGVPGPSPNTRAPMNTGDVEQVAREAAYAGAHPRWSGHRKPAGAEWLQLHRCAFSTNHARSHSTTHLMEWTPRGLGPAARRVEWKPLRAF